MPSYQVTIQFEVSDAFMQLVPPHRVYINSLINKGIIEHYAVSMEVQKAWITMNAKDKKGIQKFLQKSPLYPFWDLVINEIFVLDGQQYRLPEVNPN